MGMLIFRGVVAGLIVMGVSLLSGRHPRLGALLLTLPVVSIVAFIATWTASHDLPVLSRLSRETLVLVPLGLPFFVPLAFADRLGLGFWQAILCGLLLAAMTIGAWFWLAPGP
jgi:hypothetical protein